MFSFRFLEISFFLTSWTRSLGDDDISLGLILFPSEIYVLYSKAMAISKTKPSKVYTMPGFPDGSKRSWIGFLWNLTSTVDSTLHGSIGKNRPYAVAMGHGLRKSVTAVGCLASSVSDYVLFPEPEAAGARWGWGKASSVMAREAEYPPPLPLFPWITYMEPHIWSPSRVLTEQTSHFHE